MKILNIAQKVVILTIILSATSIYADYKYNPYTNKQDYYRGNDDIDDYFLRLDCSNDPLTGNLLLRDSIGTTPTFSSTVFPVEFSVIDHRTPSLLPTTSFPIASYIETLPSTIASFGQFILGNENSVDFVIFKLIADEDVILNPNGENDHLCRFNTDLDDVDINNDTGEDYFIITNSGLYDGIYFSVGNSGTDSLIYQLTGTPVSFPQDTSAHCQIITKKAFIGGDVLGVSTRFYSGQKSTRETLSLVSCGEDNDDVLHIEAKNNNSDNALIRLEHRGDDDVKIVKGDNFYIENQGLFSFPEIYFEAKLLPMYERLGEMYYDVNNGFQFYEDGEWKGLGGLIISVANTDTVDLTVSTGELTADVNTQMSIVSDTSGIKLDGDLASPGNSKIYGTDGSGNKGWYDQPSVWDGGTVTNDIEIEKVTPKLTLTDTDSSNDTQLYKSSSDNEFIIKNKVHVGSSASENKALGASATQSSTPNYNPAYPASLAVDGNYSNFCHTDANANEWWKVDLGQVYGIDHVRIVKRSPFTDRPNYYKVQASDDDFVSDVRDMVTANNENSLDITYDTDDFGSVSARYIRIYCITNSQYINFAEVEVWNSGGGGSDEYTTVISSKDSDGVDDYGENTFGYYAGKTILDGFTIDININSDTVAGFDDVGNFYLLNSGAIKGIFDASDLTTSDRTFTLPDKDGTFAMLSDLSNGDVIAPATNTDSYIPQWDGANSKTLKDGIAFLDEDDMASDSDTAVPSQQSVKAYVDNSMSGGYWSRSGTTLSPTTDGDEVKITSDNGEYAIIHRVDTSNEFSVYNRVEVLSGIPLNQVPAMTGYTTPSGEVSIDQTGYNEYSGYPWNAFDQNAGTEWIFKIYDMGGQYIALKYDFGSGNSQTCVGYTITNGASAENSPKDWTFQASNDNSSWDTLDTQTGQSFSANEKKSYSFTNTTPYRYYRLRMTDSNNHGSPWIWYQINEVEFCAAGSTIEESPIIKSEDSGVSDIYGINTFSNGDAYTVIDGDTTYLYIGGVEVANLTDTEFDFEDLDLTTTGTVTIDSDTNGIKFGADQDVLIYADGAGSAYLKPAADTDMALKFWGTTNTGILTWMEDEDYFKFSDDILLNSTEKIYFNDTGVAVSSKNDGYLDLEADLAVRTTAPFYMIKTGVAATPAIGVEDNVNYGLFFHNTNKNFDWAFNGSNKWVIDAAYLGAAGGTAPRLLNETASSTNPVIVPCSDDGDTGVGGDNANGLYLITGGATALTADSSQNISTSKNLTIGAGATGIDYILTFNGETNDGLITWMEDEDYFKFSDDIMILGGENIVLDTSTGTKIGTATSQLLGFYNATPVDQPAALTVGLTTITYTAPGTPDYAIQDFVDVAGDGSKGWSFTSHDEANSVLKVIENLQTKVAELESRLEELGLVASN